MVNWDPEAKTVLSNEEVLYFEEQSKLYHINYGGIVIATQRPETIFADVAIAVHPKDPRYKHLVGKMVRIPLTDRDIPVIADDYVDREFGTGALKITPAHDQNDYEVGQRHNLEVIDILTDEGRINDTCSYAPIVGQDRFEARKTTVAALQDGGFIEKEEEYTTKIGRSERTNCVVEPKLSLQWFVKMTELRDPALQAVMKNQVKFLPPHMRNTYRHWMKNIRDWCISRQLWWGQRIPAYYLPDGSVFVAETPEQALEQARKASGNAALSIADLRQDEDVLDTWASSWLWPISVFDGFNKPDGEVAYYYPSDVLVTGWDIMFFWVARMIMAGYEYRNERPFKAVYFTGMVRDKQRRKMSKSLGNSPDALKLIEDFGADGVRFGLLSSSPAGGDLLFDEKLCENGRNFCNKMWNATRLIKGWEISDKPENEAVKRKNALAVKWLQHKLKDTLTALDKDFKAFRLSDAVMRLQSFIWDDFCSWYLEMIKPTYGAAIDRKTYDATISMYSDMMRALHPFMPFITEEIWQNLQQDAGSIMLQRYPKKGKGNAAMIQAVETAKTVVSGIRDLRNQNQIKPKEELEVFVQDTPASRALFAQEGLREMVEKLASLSSLQFAESEPANSKQFIAATEKYFVVFNQAIDVEAERIKITTELEYQRGFVASVEKKLSNERFVAGAPAAVVDAERKKMADGQARITMLEESLTKL
jgi:valyl-tRNA synthetase